MFLGFYEFWVVLWVYYLFSKGPATSEESYEVYTLYAFYGFINMNEIMPLENDKKCVGEHHGKNSKPVSLTNITCFLSCVVVSWA